MTLLRERMQHDMLIRNLAENTQKSFYENPIVKYHSHLLHAAVMHLRPRSGLIERPGPLPGLPSIRASVEAGHHIQHTRKALGQASVTNAPHLLKRSS
jgi:hypothetical protein